MGKRERGFKYIIEPAHTIHHLFTTCSPRRIMLVSFQGVRVAKGESKVSRIQHSFTSIEISHGTIAISNPEDKLKPRKS